MRIIVIRDAGPARLNHHPSAYLPVFQERTHPSYVVPGAAALDPLNP
jgi:hypothetical protein